MDNNEKVVDLASYREELEDENSDRATGDVGSRSVLADQSSEKCPESNEGFSDGNNEAGRNDEVFQLDEENPLNKVSLKELTELLKRVKEAVGFAQSQWDTSRKEFQLTDDHMKSLYDYNLKNRVEKPEGGSEEDPEYDQFNGLDKITEEEVVGIFGEDHPIIGIEHGVTLSRIKSVINDFFSWMNILKEYKNIHNAYIELIELEEEREINKLREVADKETDAEKKEKLQEAVDNYYYIKHLDFLTEPLHDKSIERICKVMKDTAKIGYWIERGKDRLKQLNISEMFILQLAQLESRFLAEKYHSMNNLFLMYFIHFITHVDIHNRKNVEKSQVVSIVMAIDRLMRGHLKPEIKERILFNLQTFEDQFIGKLDAAIQ